MSFSEEEHVELDLTLLSSFIFELNISRRHVTAYPRNHPIIATAAAKVLQLLGQLLQSRDEFTIGIARDALIVGTDFLDRGNPVFRDFAKALFGLGIAAVTFRKGLVAEELLGFNEVLGKRREQVTAAGGMAQLLSDAGISNVLVRGIDYDAFTATDEDQIELPGKGDVASQPAALWEDFVRGLIEGTLDKTAFLRLPAGDFDPGALAEIMNREESQLSNDGEKVFDSTANAFLIQLEREAPASRQRLEYLNKLAIFIGKLNPVLRRQMLSSTMKSIADRKELAEEILERLPDELILETLEEVSSRHSAIPPLILSLIEKLAKHAQEEGTALPVTADNSSSENEVGDKLRVIFREDRFDEFVPDEYQAFLHKMLKTDAISMVDQEAVEGLKETLNGHFVETQVGAVILEIVSAGMDETNPEVLQRNLIDLCTYFLGMGDFASLVRILDRLSEAAPGSIGVPLKEEVLTVIARPEFVKDVLNGLVSWGKAKYPEIQSVIEMVGVPFVEPMLERLAEEQSMSLRHFYMARLVAMGDASRDAVLARLRDNRWYFIRNLLILLRSLNDPSVVRSLHRLSVHSHPKVRNELLKTLIHFNDPEGDTLLLQNMERGDEETKLDAVLLAEKSQSPQIFRQLLGFLQDNKYSGFELELKAATISTLGEIGNPEAIPQLARLINSRSFFRKRMLNRLKMEAVRSFEHYPPDAVIGLLTEVAKSRNKELALQATEIRAKVLGRVA